MAETGTDDVPEDAQDKELHEKIVEFAVSIQKVQRDPDTKAFIYDGRTKAVLDGWEFLLKQLKTRSVKNFPVLFDILYLATAKFILSGDWYEATVEFNYRNGDRLKSGLLKSLTDIREEAGELGYETERKCCTCLEPLIHGNPWKIQYCESILNGEDPVAKSSDVQQLLEKESLQLVDVRLESLCAAKLYLEAFRLAEACYVNRCRWDENTDPDSPENSAREEFQENLTDFFYLLLCRDKSGEYDKRMRTHFSVPLAMGVVRRLSESSESSRKIAPSWREWKKACKTIIYATATYLLSLQEDEVEAELARQVFRFWIKHASDDKETRKKVREEIRPVTEVLNKINSINTQFIYTLGDVLYEDYPTLPNAIQNMIELYIRAMLQDINFIAKVQVTDDQSDRKQVLERRLAERYLRIAQVFAHDPALSWEFTLTAFSLSPSEELFQKLFPPEPTTAAPAEPTSQPFQLSQALQEDLSNVMKNPRRTNLIWEKDKAELEKLCRKHLETGGPKIKSKEDLVHLHIDYDNIQYPARPQPTGDEEEELDTGFEKGYEPDYIKRQLPRHLRRYPQKRGIIVKKALPRGRPKSTTFPKIRKPLIKFQKMLPTLSKEPPRVGPHAKRKIQSLPPSRGPKRKPHTLNYPKVELNLGSFLHPEGNHPTPYPPLLEPVSVHPTVRLSQSSAIVATEQRDVDMSKVTGPKFNEGRLFWDSPVKFDFDDSQHLTEFGQLILNHLPKNLPLPTTEPIVLLDKLVPDEVIGDAAMSHGLDLVISVMKESVKSIACACANPILSPTMQSTLERIGSGVPPAGIPKEIIPQIISEVCSQQQQQQQQSELKEGIQDRPLKLAPAPKLRRLIGPKRLTQQRSAQKFLQETSRNLKENIIFKGQALGLEIVEGKIARARPLDPLETQSFQAVVANTSCCDQDRTLIPVHPNTGISDVRIHKFEDIIIAQASRNIMAARNQADLAPSDNPCRELVPYQGPNMTAHDRTEPDELIYKIVNLVYGDAVDTMADPAVTNESELESESESESELLRCTPVDKPFESPSSSPVHSHSSCDASTPVNSPGLDTVEPRTGPDVPPLATPKSPSQPHHEEPFAAAPITSNAPARPLSRSKSTSLPVSESEEWLPDSKSVPTLENEEGGGPPGGTDSQSLLTSDNDETWLPEMESKSLPASENEEWIPETKSKRKPSRSHRASQISRQRSKSATQRPKNLQCGRKGRTKKTIPAPEIIDSLDSTVENPEGPPDVAPPAPDASLCQDSTKDNLECPLDTPQSAPPPPSKREPPKPDLETLENHSKYVEGELYLDSATGLFQPVDADDALGFQSAEFEGANNWDRSGWDDPMEQAPDIQLPEVSWNPDWSFKPAGTSKGAESAADKPTSSVPLRTGADNPTPAVPLRTDDDDTETQAVPKKADGDIRTRARPPKTAGDETRTREAENLARASDEIRRLVDKKKLVIRLVRLPEPLARLQQTSRPTSGSESTSSSVISGHSRPVRNRARTNSKDEPRRPGPKRRKAPPARASKTSTISPVAERRSTRTPSARKKSLSLDDYVGVGKKKSVMTTRRRGASSSRQLRGPKSKRAKAQSDSDTTESGGTIQLSDSEPELPESPQVLGQCELVGLNQSSTADPLTPEEPSASPQALEEESDKVILLTPAESGASGAGLFDDQSTTPVGPNLEVSDDSSEKTAAVVNSGNWKNFEIHPNEDMGDTDSNDPFGVPEEDPLNAPDAVLPDLNDDSKGSLVIADKDICFAGVIVEGTEYVEVAVGLSMDSQGSSEPTIEEVDLTLDESELSLEGLPVQINQPSSSASPDPLESKPGEDLLIDSDRRRSEISEGTDPKSSHRPSFGRESFQAESSIGTSGGESANETDAILSESPEVTSIVSETSFAGTEEFRCTESERPECSLNQPDIPTDSSREGHFLDCDSRVLEIPQALSQCDSTVRSNMENTDPVISIAHNGIDVSGEVVENRAESPLENPVGNPAVSGPVSDQPEQIIVSDDGGSVDRNDVVDMESAGDSNPTDPLHGLETNSPGSMSLSDVSNGTEVVSVTVELPQDHPSGGHVEVSEPVDEDHIQSRVEISTAVGQDDYAPPAQPMRSDSVLSMECEDSVVTASNEEASELDAGPGEGQVVVAVSSKLSKSQLEASNEDSTGDNRVRSVALPAPEEFPAVATTIAHKMRQYKIVDFSIELERVDGYYDATPRRVLTSHSESEDPVSDTELENGVPSTSSCRSRSSSPPESLCERTTEESLMDSTEECSLQKTSNLLSQHSSLPEKTTGANRNLFPDSVVTTSNSTENLTLPDDQASPHNGGTASNNDCGSGTSISAADKLSPISTGLKSPPVASTKSGTHAELVPTPTDLKSSSQMKSLVEISKCAIQAHMDSTSTGGKSPTVQNSAINPKYPSPTQPCPDFSDGSKSPSVESQVVDHIRLTVRTPKMISDSSKWPEGNSPPPLSILHDGSSRGEMVQVISTCNSEAPFRKFTALPVQPTELVKVPQFSPNSDPIPPDVALTTVWEVTVKSELPVRSPLQSAKTYSVTVPPSAFSRQSEILPLVDSPPNPVPRLNGVPLGKDEKVEESDHLLPFPFVDGETVNSEGGPLVDPGAEPFHANGNVSPVLIGLLDKVMDSANHLEHRCIPNSPISVDTTSENSLDAEVRHIMEPLGHEKPKGRSRRRKRRVQASLSPDITNLAGRKVRKSAASYTLRQRDLLTQPSKYSKAIFEVPTLSPSLSISPSTTTTMITAGPGSETGKKTRTSAASVRKRGRSQQSTDSLPVLTPHHEGSEVPWNEPTDPMVAAPHRQNNNITKVKKHRGHRRSQPNEDLEEPKSLPVLSPHKEGADGAGGIWDTLSQDVEQIPLAGGSEPEVFVKVPKRPKGKFGKRRRKSFATKSGGSTFLEGNLKLLNCDGSRDDLPGKVIDAVKKPRGRPRSKSAPSKSKKKLMKVDESQGEVAMGSPLDFSNPIVRSNPEEVGDHLADARKAALEPSGITNGGDFELTTLPSKPDETRKKSSGPDLGTTGVIDLIVEIPIASLDASVQRRLKKLSKKRKGKSNSKKKLENVEDEAHSEVSQVELNGRAAPSPEIYSESNGFENGTLVHSGARNPVVPEGVEDAGYLRQLIVGAEKERAEIHMLGFSPNLGVHSAVVVPTKRSSSKGNEGKSSGGKRRKKENLSGDSSSPTDLIVDDSSLPPTLSSADDDMESFNGQDQSPPRLERQIYF